MGAAIADFNKDGLSDVGVITYQAQSAADQIQIPMISMSVLLRSNGMPSFAATAVSAADFEPPVSAGSVASAFGSNLATMTAAADRPPWPTNLGGIELHLRDLEGTVHVAPLLFVSLGQINYQVPPGIRPGVASISVVRSDLPLDDSGQALLVSYDGAPSFFTVNPEGLAAANAVRVHHDHSQTRVPVIACKSSPCTAVPIDVTGDPVYLSLYGTGFDLSDIYLASLNCSANGKIDLPVTYYGPQGYFPGLDQINVKLPSSLAGSGDTIVSCVLGSTGTNAVHLLIK
jgi:uncharacterized protein (TIGR03437 family)